ncbi:MAG: ABC transporter permease [Eubacteriales bacterium]|nr:ABC transporter permease [Eubacteriales bacterium]
MGENIRLAFHSIWVHKMRSALTMLGIIIGIASIIAIVSTIKGTNEQIKENLIGAGNNVITVELCQDGSPVDMSYSQLPAGISEVSDRTYRELACVPKVENLSLYTMRQYIYDAVYYKNTTFNGGTIIGADSDYLDVYQYQVSSGRPFLEDDYKKYHKVALLDQAAASTLFANEDPIGKTIDIKKEPFTVIGVIVPSKSSAPAINSYQDYYMYMDQTSGTILIPNVVWPIPFQYDEPQNVALRASSTDDMTNIGQKASDILNSGLSVDAASDSGSSFSYESKDIMESAQQLQELSESSNKQLIWIASISLLVGAIGVMNIMLVSVTERTREIGLKKALGAKPSVILSQFLTEAAVLACIGGIIGVAGGIIMAKIISLLTGTPTAISIPAIFIAVALSALIGIISGVFPAVKAAKLNPIDALRRE